MSATIAAVKAHSKLIQFPTRVKWTPNLNFPAISVPQPAAAPTPPTPPTASTASFDAPDTIEVFRVIPDRYRRRPVELYELEFIQNGGPL